MVNVSLLESWMLSVSTIGKGVGNSTGYRMWVSWSISVTGKGVGNSTRYRMIYIVNVCLWLSLLLSATGKGGETPQAT
jgi:hypothetical protein